MVEVIKAEVDRGLATRFRKLAMERHGYKKGAMKMALEDLIRRYTAKGSVDWSALRGVVKSPLSSLELQHRAFRAAD